jgi:hypothetical protein
MCRGRPSPPASGPPGAMCRRIAVRLALLWRSAAPQLRTTLPAPSGLPPGCTWPQQRWPRWSTTKKNRPSSLASSSSSSFFSCSRCSAFFTPSAKQQSRHIVRVLRTHPKRLSSAPITIKRCPAACHTKYPNHPRLVWEAILGARAMYGHLGPGTLQRYGRAASSYGRTALGLNGSFCSNRTAQGNAVRFWKMPLGILAWATDVRDVVACVVLLAVPSTHRGVPAIHHLGLRPSSTDGVPSSRWRD